jgi:hypothetical protein
VLDLLLGIKKEDEGSVEWFELSDLARRRSEN